MLGFLGIPDEVLHHLLRYCDWETFAKISLSCKAASGPTLWTSVVEFSSENTKYQNHHSSTHESSKDELSSRCLNSLAGVSRKLIQHGTSLQAIHFFHHVGEDVVKLFLERGSQLKAVSLTQASRNDLPPFLRALNSEKLESIGLKVKRNHDEALPEFFARPFPLLRRLELRFHWRTTLQDIFDNFLKTAHFPGLKELTCTVVDLFVDEKQAIVQFIRRHSKTLDRVCLDPMISMNLSFLDAIIPTSDCVSACAELERSLGVPLRKFDFGTHTILDNVLREDYSFADYCKGFNELFGTQVASQDISVSEAQSQCRELVRVTSHFYDNNVLYFLTHHRERLRQSCPGLFSARSNGYVNLCHEILQMPTEDDDARQASWKALWECFITDPFNTRLLGKLSSDLQQRMISLPLSDLLKLLTQGTCEYLIEFVKQDRARVFEILREASSLGPFSAKVVFEWIRIVFEDDSVANIRREFLVLLLSNVDDLPKQNKLASLGPQKDLIYGLELLHQVRLIRFGYGVHPMVLFEHDKISEWMESEGDLSLLKTFVESYYRALGMIDRREVNAQEAIWIDIIASAADATLLQKWATIVFQSYQSIPTRVQSFVGGFNDAVTGKMLPSKVPDAHLVLRKWCQQHNIKYKINGAPEESGLACSI